MSPPPVLCPGLCSVTLRALAPVEVIRIARDAGLHCIEWGADVHVPPGDLAAAADVRAATLDAGLGVASYGSYFRAGADRLETFAEVLASAVALGAGRIRIWAGARGSASASADDRRATVTVTRQAAELAAEQGIELAFEFHGGTLTDTTASTLRLLGEVDRPDVRTYWQPPVDTDDEAALIGLEPLLDHLSGLHVFSWWPGTTRRPLEARSELWRSVVERVRGRGRTLDALLEFVPDDDPAQVAAAAATLRSWTEPT